MVLCLHQTWVDCALHSAIALIIQAVVRGCVCRLEALAIFMDGFGALWAAANTQTCTGGVHTQLACRGLVCVPGSLRKSFAGCRPFACVAARVLTHMPSSASCCALVCKDTIRSVSGGVHQ